MNEMFVSARPVAPGHHMFLKRARLDSLVYRAMDCPVVLVLGGAGYGKTHAVYSFLQQQEIRTIWIQLTERDNIGDRFWENFTRSISMFNGESAGKLAKQGFPVTDRDFEQYLAVPLADVDPQVKLVFVFDDFHLIHDKTVLRFLERSVKSPFPSITSILISRREVNINLMNLYSKGLVSCIYEEELRFTRDEVNALFSMLNVSAAPDTVEGVYRDTEGWAFAVHLSAVFFALVPSGEGFGVQIRRDVFRMIEGEVMERMDAGLRKFLIKLSLLDESTPDLVRELARFQDTAGGGTGREGGSLIRKIEQIGSLIRFDEYSHVFSMHQLFRDYLVCLQDELSEDEKKEVYRTAAAWCAKNNLRIDAISYYQKAGDYEELLSQFYFLPLGLSLKTLERLTKIMEGCPREMYLKYENSYVVLGRFLVFGEQFEKMDEQIRELIAIQEKLPESSEQNRILFGCWSALGFINKIMATKWKDFAFPGYFEKAHYYFDKWGGKITGPLSTSPLGSYACLCSSPDPAEMDRCFAALAAAIPHAAACLNGNMQGLEELARGELAFFRMEMDNAENFLREGLIKAHEFRQYEIEVRCYFYLMRIGFFQGNTDLINESCTGMKTLRKQEDYVNRYAYDDIYRGWFFAHIGDCEKLSSWLLSEEDAPNSLIRGQELLVKAKAFLREEKYGAVLLAIRRTERNVRHFIMGQIETKIMEAVCLYQMKLKNEAYTALENARLLAEPGGLFLPFAEMGKDMRSLALQAKKDEAPIPGRFLEWIRNLSSVYAKKLFLASGELPAATGSGTPSELSRKERDILLGLFHGLTQEEIARSTSRSANTIKSIIKRIYEKLGAINKADAIRIAINRGILNTKGTPSSPPADPGDAKPAERRLLLRKEM
jgi:LuxR family maltose regulon positive regulatory protein